MNREDALSLNDLLKLGAATLATLPDAEIDTAVAWLEEHVVAAPNVAAQLILFQTWVSVWSKSLFERVYEGSK